ncbi:MAG: hypothetical protein ACLQVD_01370 [Capsulimonadaceae bacterium]
MKLDSNMPFDSRFDSYGHDDDEDDDEDDDQQQDDGSQDDDDSDIQDTGGASSYDSGDADSSAITNAAPHEQDAHRTMIGEVVQHLSDSGIDVDELAEKAGIESSDVEALTHDDLATLTQYVSQHHPELVQDVSTRYPAAQGILGALTGGMGGLLGKFFG